MQLQTVIELNINLCTNNLTSYSFRDSCQRNVTFMDTLKFTPPNYVNISI